MAGMILQPVQGAARQFAKESFDADARLSWHSVPSWGSMNQPADSSVRAAPRRRISVGGYQEIGSRFALKATLSPCAAWLYLLLDKQTGFRL